jgi:DNA invertase Pin-like site-specific DNA recombinase
MGRSLQDLLGILERINASGAGFRSLTEPIDTGTPAGKLMFSVLGAVAEFERSMIQERTRAGIQAARVRGATLGRPRVLSVEVEDGIVSLIDARAVTYRECAELFGVEEYVVSNAVYRGRRRLAGIDWRKRGASGRPFLLK